MMLLFPKKTKFTKGFSGKSAIAKTVAKHRINSLGNISLVAVESGKIPNFQLESLRRFLRKFLKKRAQIFFRAFPNVPITKKPNDVRLGRGKGNVKYWASLVRCGSVILELRGVNKFLLKKVLKSAQIKLSTKTIISDKQQRWIL